MSAKRQPKRGDHLVKDRHHRIVIWVEPPMCCNGTGKTLVIPVTGRMSYHTRCYNRCTRKTLPDRTTVGWTRRLPKPMHQPVVQRCTLREWWEWAKDAAVAPPIGS